MAAFIVDEQHEGRTKDTCLMPNPCISDTLRHLSTVTFRLHRLRVKAEIFMDLQNIRTGYPELFYAFNSRGAIPEIGGNLTLGEYWLG